MRRWMRTRASIIHYFFSCLRVLADKATRDTPHLKESHQPQVRNRTGTPISKNILNCSTQADILYALQRTLNMPQSLAKVTKKITRKKGRATGLHEKSRDAAKLRKASAREERVHRVNATKSRAEEGYGTFEGFPNSFPGPD
jgi:Translation machinery-associated protein 16